MDFSTVEAITIPDGDVTKIEVNGSIIWELVEAPSYTNQVPISIDTDGNIYNGCGYKDGYRVRSGGAEAVQAYSAITGFIPVNIGDVIRIYPPFTGKNTQNIINFADSEFNNLGQITDSGIGYGICSGKVSLYKTSVVDGVSTLTLTSEHGTNIKYIRVGNHIGKDGDGNYSLINSGSEMIVTINEEII